MVRISKADRFLIMSLWKEKKWGAKRLIRVSWKAMAEDKYYSSASKNRQLQDNQKEVGQTQ